jgi:hypothetical protein
MNTPNKIIRDIERPLKSINKINRDMERLVKPINKINQDIERLFKPIDRLIEATNNFIEETPKKWKEKTVILAKQGWYYDVNAPINRLLKVDNLIEKDILDDIQIDYFRKEMNNIRENAIKKHPKRKEIINSSFNAHERKEYELSIPVLFTQIDGIYDELAEDSFFSWSNKGQAKSDFINNLHLTDIDKAALILFTEQLPVLYSRSKRKKEKNESGMEFNALNRNQVLHGEVTDYASEINSLKTISLLNYVVQMLDHIKEIKNTE